MTELLERLTPIAPLLLLLVLASRWVLRVHNGPSDARISDLVTNRHGRLDMLMCAFWIALLVNVWVVVYSVINGSAPDGVVGVLAAFNATIASPIIVKVVANALAPPEPPQ